MEGNEQLVQMRAIGGSVRAKQKFTLPAENRTHLFAVSTSCSLFLIKLFFEISILQNSHFPISPSSSRWSASYGCKRTRFSCVASGWRPFARVSSRSSRDSTLSDRKAMYKIGM